MNKSNCKKHIVPDYLKDIRKVAEDISNMPYDKVVEFFKHMENKLKKDADNDYEGGRFKLETQLRHAAFWSFKIRKTFEKIWEICEPYMKE
jgi:hypothetical protein